MTGQLSNSTTLKPGIIPLAQATDPTAAGHKAATLVALLGAGLPVPDGSSSQSVSLPPAVRVRSPTSWLPSWPPRSTPGVTSRGGALVRHAEDLPYASYAGLCTTVPDVRGEAAPREAVSRCWASTRAPRVTAYAAVTTLPDEPIQPVPLPVEPPEGYWGREASHSPLPWTPFTHAVFEARSRGIRQMCTELGLLFETVDPRDIGGWEDLRIVPLGGKEPPALPAWVAPLAFRLVPSLRRRIRRSVAAMRSDVPAR